MPVVLCYGDSNTWGYDPATTERLAPDVRWTGVMASALGPSVRVIEEGLPGRTSVFDDPIEDFAAERNGAKYLRPCLASHRPLDLIVLMLGTNDCKRRFAAAPSDIAQGVGELVRMIRASQSGPDGAAPLVLAIAPAPITDAGGFIGDLFGGGVETSRRVAPMLAEIAARQGARFLDAAPLWNVSPLDGIHFAAEEHARFGVGVADIVREMLAIPHPAISR